MNKQYQWILEDFLAGNIPCQKIQFEFNGFTYAMVFNLIEETHDEASIREKAEELNIDYRRNSYEIKFDLQSTFESEDIDFFTPPERKATPSQLLELGQILAQLLQFHYQNSNAETYFFVAADSRLKHFYDRVIRKYASTLGFQVRNNLREEGLAYEIITPSFKH